MSLDQIERILGPVSMNIDICSDCGKEMEVGEWPFCPHGRSTQHRFPPVEVDLGRLGKHTVNSHADFSRLERMHKRETGQEISFRAMNMEPSKQDVNSMGAGPQIDPKAYSAQRKIRFGTKRGGEYRGR